MPGEWTPTKAQLAAGPQREVIFFVPGYFYVIKIFDGEPIENHVNLNPRTIRVEDANTRDVLWPKKLEVVK